jgi:hypothetical protein
MSRKLSGWVDEDDYYDDYDEDYDDDEYCDDDEYYEKGGKVGKSEKEQERVTVSKHQSEKEQERVTVLKSKAPKHHQHAEKNVSASSLEKLVSRLHQILKMELKFLSNHTLQLSRKEKHTRIRANLICLWLF